MFESVITKLIKNVSGMVYIRMFGKRYEYKVTSSIKLICITEVIFEIRIKNMIEDIEKSIKKSIKK
jgi:DNA gyrase/topoisomerase IV subunit A